MVIGSLCPISVGGMIRGLRWGIGPKGGEALSSYHIWTFILYVRMSARPSGKIWGVGVVTDRRNEGRTDEMNVHI
jgi:hypothetical protein